MWKVFKGEKSGPEILVACIISLIPLLNSFILCFIVKVKYYGATKFEINKYQENIVAYQVSADYCFW